MPASSLSLTSGGTTLVLTSNDGRLPVVTYWGAELPPTDDLTGTLTPQFVSDQTERLAECSLLPEESSGTWTSLLGQQIAQPTGTAFTPVADLAPWETAIVRLGG